MCSIALASCESAGAGAPSTNANTSINATKPAGTTTATTDTKSPDDQVARADNKPGTDFATWLVGLRRDAIASGIKPATLDIALEGVAPIPRVIELDHAQPETKLTFAQYVQRVASPARQDGVRRNLAENQALLDEVSQRFHVQPRFIVALWGIETDFGRTSGDFPVIAALATLAYDGRRSAFFRRELIAALKIADRDQIDPRIMRGSWAGAMGQSQFMPSSFLQYAVSYRADGRPDIWNRREDVFASIANYLAKIGWREDETWGRTVSAPHGLDPALIGPGVKKSLTEWQRLGVRRDDGGALPNREVEASLLEPEGEGGPAILAYANFRTLLKWNNSSAFATAVGYLADSAESR